MKMKNVIWISLVVLLATSACTTSRYNLKLNKADWTAPEKPEARPMDRVPAATIEPGESKDLGESNAAKPESNQTVSKSKVKREPIDRNVAQVERENKVSEEKIPSEIKTSFRDNDLPLDNNITPKESEVMEESALGSQHPKQTTSDVHIIILVILAIILPPLAVFLFEEASTRFWITLVLFIIGWGVGIWLLGIELAGLCALAAVIYALLIVLGVI